MAKERETRGGFRAKRVLRRSRDRAVPFRRFRKETTERAFRFRRETGPKNAARLSSRLSVCGTKSKR